MTSVADLPLSVDRPLWGWRGCFGCRRCTLPRLSQWWVHYFNSAEPALLPACPEPASSEQEEE